jgi:hypothetical protein
MGINRALQAPFFGLLAMLINAAVADLILWLHILLSGSQYRSV